MKTFIYDRSTLLQGLTIGTINTYILFELNKESVILASLWTVAFILGTIISGFVKIKRVALLNTIATISRISTIPLLFITESTMKISLLFLAGSIQSFTSRKQFIILKDLVSSVDVNKLTKHGSMNAVGYGIGAVIAGLLHDKITLYILFVTIFILTNYMLFPNKQVNLYKSKNGLTKRDLYVASIFTIAIVPLNNSLGMLIYTNIFDEKIASLGAFLYNIGSLLASNVKKYIIMLKKPIGLSVMFSSILFLSTIIYTNQIYYYITRVIVGTLLFASQGLLEERSKINNGKINKGIEQLWQIFSFFSLLAMLVLPTIGQKFGYFTLGILSLLASIIIMSLKIIIR